jgi:hypothetical protein
MNLQGTINEGAAAFRPLASGGVGALVNSMECKNRMTFRVSLPQKHDFGGFAFLQEKRPKGGWVMKYNC